jgi:hypothetical protein
MTQSSADAYHRARDFLYAQLNGLREPHDILLEGTSPASENIPAGSVSIRNILGEAAVMTADCRRKECVLVYNMSKSNGWHAYADGTSLPISRANFAFMAVKLPQGTHEVWFVYAPLSTFWFIMASMLGLCLLPFMRDRKTPTQETLTA